MSDASPPPSDAETQPSGATEPFRRGRIVWGRPPETVFRAGPLPRPPQSWSAPLKTPAQPPRPTPRPTTEPSTNIFTGSMIPRAVPERPLPGERPLTPEIEEPKPTPAPRSKGAESAAGPTPSPKPAPEPAAHSGPRVETLAAPEAGRERGPGPVPASATTGSQGVPRPPALAPEPLAKTPASPVLARPSVAQTTGRRGLMIGAAIAATAALGALLIWALNRPPAAPLPYTVSAGSGTPSPVGVTPALEPLDAIPAGNDAPLPPEPEAAPALPARVEPTPAPAPAAPPAPTPSTPTPMVVPPVSPPAIETAPLIVTPPTAAEAPPSDPDAPIATRPQPLT